MDGQWFKTSQHMGLHGKKANDFTPEKIDKLVKKDKKGYNWEVDALYPKELHEKHKKLTLFAERMKIGKIEKLLPSLKDKKTNVLHIKSLNQAWLENEKGAPGYWNWTKLLDEVFCHVE